MKKTNLFKITTVSLLSALMMTSCGMFGDFEKDADDDDDSRPAKTTTEQPIAETTQPEETTRPEVQTEETTTESIPEPSVMIDPFDGLEVQFDGISPYVNVNINNSQCSEEVQQLIKFTYDDSVNIANGDGVTVRAEYDAAALEEANIQLVQEEKTYEVSGLPFYVDDFSDIDCTVLDEELHKFMDSRYMFNWKSEKMLSHKGFYQYASATIMGVQLDSEYDNFYFDKFVSSNVENTYSLSLKPDLISQCKVNDSGKSDSSNTFNYYYRMYHNVYTIRPRKKYNDSYDKCSSADVDIFICMRIKNVIAYPDGTLKYDMTFDFNGNILKEQAYFEGISSKGDSYNITEVK